VAGVAAAVMVGVVGAAVGSWFGSTRAPVMSSEEASAVARVALGDVSPPVSVERVSTARPFAYHGDVVEAGYVRLTYDADFGDQWRSVADFVASRLRAAGWSVRTHGSFFLDDPAYVDVAASRGATAVLVEVDETGVGLSVDVTNVVPARLMPLTLLGGLIGLALGGLLGAGPIARRFGRAGSRYRWSALAFGTLALAGLVPGASIGLLVAMWSWLVDSRFATPFWLAPAAIVSNGDPFMLALATGLIGLTVTFWRARPQPSGTGMSSTLQRHAD
jgi:hypothetical protein